MANPPAISPALRLVAIKTGFEALFGESKAWNCAKALNDLFLQATARHRAFLPWTGVLWSPTDRTDVRATNPDCPAEHRATPRSEIQDWFMNLAYARNAIIHAGALRTGSYTAPPERPLSRYSGSLFWIGERVLREAIEASLTPDILLSGRYPRALVELIRSEAPGAGSSTISTPDVSRKLLDDTVSATAASPRSVGEILAELGCPGANHIQLEKATGGCGADLEKAREHAAKLLDKWGAKFEDRTVLISSAERELLLQAGAEDQIPYCWFDCD
jgi:hypothetical protein